MGGGGESAGGGTAAGGGGWNQTEATTGTAVSVVPADTARSGVVAGAGAPCITQQRGMS